MYKAKFFRVAGSLDHSSWKRFRKFVHTRPQLRSEKVGHFLDQVFAAHPEFDLPWIGREALHARIFPDLPYRDQRLYDHLSYLYDLLEAFLILENRRGDIIADELVLLDYFRRSGLVRDFQQTVKRAGKKLDALPSGPDKSLAGYHLASRQEALYSSQLKEQARSKDDGLQGKMDSLELHFLRVRLQYSCEMFNRKNVVGTSYYTDTLVHALKMYEAAPERFAADPVIGVYYQALQMFLDPDDGQAYHTLRKLLERQAEVLPPNEAHTLYTYAQNFCIRRINEGQAEYFDFLFDLYVEMLDRGTIYEDGRLSQWDYKNIVSLGLRLDKTDWVANFIELARDQIAPDYRDNAYCYNRAYFDYSTRNYPGALRQLQQVEFPDVFYHLGTKAIQMKIYYELEETEVLLSLLTTFKTYLRRQKGISAYQRRTHQNLVKYVQKLDRLRERGPRMKKPAYIKELQQLQAQAQAADGVSNLKWLIGQIELLLSASEAK